MDDSRIVTAPDLDISNRFKILLVDCEWSDVERFSQIIKSMPEPVTIFLYGSKESDDVWCINAAKQATACLINCRFQGNKEILKGYLLAQDNVWALGENAIGKATHRQTFDLYSWLAERYANYQKHQEEKNEF
jgi:hypothetical protein